MGDLGSIPGLGRFPGEVKGYPLQYSGLENSTDCIVMGLPRVRRNWVTFTFYVKKINLLVSEKFRHQEPLGILVREWFNVRSWAFPHLLKGPKEWTQSQASRNYFQNIEGLTFWEGCSLCSARTVRAQEATTGTFESHPFRDVPAVPVVKTPPSSAGEFDPWLGN